MNTQATAALQTISGEHLALKRVAVTGEMQNLLAEITVAQAFENSEPVNIEAVYTFPLPLDAILLAFSVTLGERELQGRILPARQAEDRYEDAVTDGDTAIMLRESGPGLYTVNVGNLQSGETALLRYRYALLQRWNGDSVRFRLPACVAQRYGDPGAAGLAPHEQPETAIGADLSYSLDLRISGILSKAELQSPSHAITVTDEAGGRRVTFSREAAAMDRDFVLNLRCADGVRDSAQADRDRNGYVALASFQPDFGDRGERQPGRYVLLVDCSGSMAGDSIAQAREALARILGGLSPTDSFNLIAFGSSHRSLFTVPMPADPAHIDLAHAWVRDLHANLGGTEMAGALAAAYASMGREHPGDVLLITDGQVWNDGQLVAEARRSRCRVFTVGVGSSVSEACVRRLAEATGGACELVTPREDMAERIHRHFQRLRAPGASAVTVHWPATPKKQFPEPLGPMHQGDTRHILAWFDSPPRGAVRLELTLADGSRLIQTTALALDEPTSTDDVPATLARVAAGMRLREFEDGEARTLVAADRRLYELEQDAAQAGAELAVDYQLMSPWTNCLVVDVRADDGKAADLPELRKVPQMPAAGLGGMGSVMCDFDAGELGSASGTMASARSITRESRAALSVGDDDVAEFSIGISGIDDFVYWLNDQSLDDIRHVIDSRTIESIRWLGGGLPEKLHRAFNDLLAQGADEKQLVFAFLTLLADYLRGRPDQRAIRRLIVKAVKADPPDAEAVRSVRKALNDITGWRELVNGSAVPSVPM